jgi:hypothetical protein
MRLTACSAAAIAVRGGSTRSHEYPVDRTQTSVAPASIAVRDCGVVDDGAINQKSLAPVDDDSCGREDRGQRCACGHGVDRIAFGDQYLFARERVSRDDDEWDGRIFDPFERQVHLERCSKMCVGDEVRRPPQERSKAQERFRREQVIAPQRAPHVGEASGGPAASEPSAVNRANRRTHDQIRNDAAVRKGHRHSHLDRAEAGPAREYERSGHDRENAGPATAVPDRLMN